MCFAMQVQGLLEQACRLSTKVDLTGLHLWDLVL